MQIPMMNFLSKTAEEAREYRLTKHKLKNILVLIIGVLISAVAAEGILATYNHFNMQVLRTESAEQLLRENEEMKKLIDLAIIARNEHNELVHIVDLLAIKPKNLKLSRVEADSKNITIEAFAIDSKVFNEYTESKRDEKFFSELKVEKITAITKSPYKTCIIRADIGGNG